METSSRIRHCNSRRQGSWIGGVPEGAPAFVILVVCLLGVELSFSQGSSYLSRVHKLLENAVFVFSMCLALQ